MTDNRFSDERYQLTEEKSALALDVLRQRLNRQLEASLEVCVRCGLCAESCHYYLANPKPEYVPAYRAEQLRKIYRQLFDPLGKAAPGWVGAAELDQEMVEKLMLAAYGTCTMCGRCVINCPMGVDTRHIIRTARAMLTAMDMTPAGLKATVDVHLEVGNNMGVSEEDYVETVQWMEEELQAELDDPGVKIPFNKKGARVVYTFNPREIKYFPYLIQAAAKIFNAAGEDWTLSTESWDATNYGLFNGDDTAARQIAANLEGAVNHLGAETLVMAECGHGYRSQRWEGENWAGHHYPFQVLSFVELQALYIKEKRFKLDPTVNSQRVTYHDPCNQARSGGIIEEPRYVLRHVATDFVEMTPHGAENFCCSGGGGMLSMTEFAKERIAAGKVKADQITATGAKIVVTSCHNCLDQLDEIKRHYKLPVKIQNLSELTAAAIVWEKKGQ
ncbi:MAG TPA: (Fe-S)-binding protein [Anaerolineales bacterium]|nr:(Fe-S)-binding protein [Anaerolineales bacterium]